MQVLISYLLALLVSLAQPLVDARPASSISPTTSTGMEFPPGNSPSEYHSPSHWPMLAQLVALAQPLVKVWNFLTWKFAQ